MRLVTLVIVAVLGLVVLIDSVQAQRVYRWVDESGQVHFTQTPPPESPLGTDVIDFDHAGKVDAACCNDVRRFASSVAGYMLRGLGSLEIYEIFPPDSYPEVVEVSNFVAARIRGEMSPSTIAGHAHTSCMNRGFQACRLEGPTGHRASGGSGRASGSGSGIVIADNIILTNHHVAGRCNRIEIGERRVSATLLGHDASIDLALVRAELDRVQYPALRTDSRVRLGESVVVAGFPLGDLLGSINITTGAVSSEVGLAGRNELFQFTAPVQPGSSGGPVLDQSGLLIGVVVARISDAQALRTSGALPQNVNFAIRPAEVRRFLDRHDIAFAESNARNVLPNPAIAEHARSYTTRVFCIP